MNKVSAIALVLGSAAIVVIFLFLDNSLSGGSASDPTLAYIFLALCLGYIVFVLLSEMNSKKYVVGLLLALLPFFLLLSQCLGSRDQMLNDPSHIAGRTYAENMDCILDRMKASEDVLLYVGPRLNVIRHHGVTPTRVFEQDIESYLGIEVGPNCTFTKTR
jgi:hypothetical protein